MDVGFVVGFVDGFIVGSVNGNLKRSVDRLVEGMVGGWAHGRVGEVVDRRSKGWLRWIHVGMCDSRSIGTGSIVIGWWEMGWISHRIT